MPPFVNTKCKHCSKSNRFDLGELRKEDDVLSKGVIFRGDEKKDEEFEVTCQHCGKKFKFMLKGGGDGKEK